jgi:hypothetical protein
MSRRFSRRSWLQLAGGSILSAQNFVDIAGPAGLSSAKNVSGSTLNKQTLIEEMGAGVAFIDYDADGWCDLFFVNGSTLPPDSRKPTCYLFHNNRDGTFTDVTRKSGLGVHSGWGQACCVGDFDNDGFEDLFVSYFGRNVLYRNNGDGTFTDVTAKAGLPVQGARWGAGCAFLDYDRDGRLDLFVSNYVAYDAARAPKPGSSPLCRYNEIPVPCGPQGFAGGTNILYRNRGDGTFEDVSETSGIGRQPRGASEMTFRDRDWHPAGAYAMGVVCADLDNDGWPDIYVASDSAPSLLYRNNHDGTFREIAVPAGCAFDENGTAMSGMGVAAGDYNGDGWLDLIRTNFSDQAPTLYRNNGDGTFQDAGIGAGLGVNRRNLGFGVGFLDMDNDGWKDLFMANGHVYAQLASRNLHISYAQPRNLYRNLGNGRFADVSSRSGPGMTTPAVGRGCAFGDFDNDGDIDIVINNLDSAPSLLRNDGASRGHWIGILCRGTKSNRSAIGARVAVTSGGRTQIDEVISGSSYYSQNDLRLHFGLGQTTEVDRVEVRWPSGLKESFSSLTADRFYVVEEAKGIRAGIR